MKLFRRLKSYTLKTTALKIYLIWDQASLGPTSQVHSTLENINNMSVLKTSFDTEDIFCVKFLTHNRYFIVI